jgi:hypothetical protein
VRERERVSAVFLLTPLTLPIANFHVHFFIYHTSLLIFLYVFTMTAQVLRAKEVCIPEENCNSSSDSDSHSDALNDSTNAHIRGREKEKGKERWGVKNSGIDSDCYRGTDDTHLSGGLNDVNQKEKEKEKEQVKKKQKEIGKENIPWMKNRKNRNGVLLE